MTALELDGSHGEGGGQLTRYAMALSAITGRPIHLRRIRAGRAKPGLKAQHLTGLRAVAAVSGGVLEGAALGASEISFHPGHSTGGTYHFDVGTAGAITLVLQALLPVALHADGPSTLSVTGGTDVSMAPPLDFFRLVFLPWLERLGAEVRVELVRRGYFPRGGGEVRLTVTPCARWRPLLAVRPGPAQEIRGLAHVAHLASTIAERFATSARTPLAHLAPMHLEVRTLSGAEAAGAGGALALVAQTERSLLGAATVAERGAAAERLGRDTALALRAELEAGAGVDVHAADQVLFYAALAREPSSFTVRSVSLHTETVMWLVEQFLPVRFTVTPVEGLARIDVVPLRSP